MNTEWDRDERSLTSVAATLRRLLANARRVFVWDGEVKDMIVRSVTRVVLVLGSCLISCFLVDSTEVEGERRSLIVSLY